MMVGEREERGSTGTTWESWDDAQTMGKGHKHRRRQTHTQRQTCNTYIKKNIYKKKKGRAPQDLKDKKERRDSVSVYGSTTTWRHTGCRVTGR